MTESRKIQEMVIRILRKIDDFEESIIELVKSQERDTQEIEVYQDCLLAKVELINQILEELK